LRLDRHLHIEIVQLLNHRAKLKQRGIATAENNQIRTRRPLL
jgi:hypothetical protein